MKRLAASIASSPASLGECWAPTVAVAAGVGDPREIGEPCPISDKSGDGGDGGAAGCHGAASQAAARARAGNASTRLSGETLSREIFVGAEGATWICSAAARALGLSEFCAFEGASPRTGASSLPAPESPAPSRPSADASPVNNAWDCRNKFQRAKAPPSMFNATASGDVAMTEPFADRGATDEDATLARGEAMRQTPMQAKDQTAKKPVSLVLVRRSSEFSPPAGAERRDHDGNTF